MRVNKPKKNIKADTKKVNSIDVCQTPPHALEPLYPYLNKEWLIWESARGPERLIEKTLRNKGYWCIGTDLSDGDMFNFFTFELPSFDIQITNPPFSVKYEWLERSFALGKRFALLVPYETTAAAKFMRLFKQYNGKPWQIEVLAPERRIVYKMPNKGWDSSPQMPTCWITWGLEIHHTKNIDETLFTYYVPMRNAKYNEDNKEI
jgi:hypothetical protein